MGRHFTGLGIHTLRAQLCAGFRWLWWPRNSVIRAFVWSRSITDIWHRTMCPTPSAGALGLSASSNLQTLEQQVTETLGVCAHAGWNDGNLKTWDNTDINRTAELGVSINGKPWGRADDTVGFAGVINSISSNFEAFLNAGGLGVLIGDGQLPHPGLEQIFETYYSYALTPSTNLSFDYQFIADPAYNTDRGPPNVFSGRFHWQY